jgi:hypothetical protein
VNTLEWAYLYADLGWHAFPLAEGSKLPKISTAAGGRGFLDATINRDQLRGWFTRWLRANIGIRMGPTSGLFGLDVDVRHRGDESLRRLIAKHGNLPNTLRARTPSGGFHFYFAWPGIELRNSAGLLDDGLDTRGNGGYLAAAPSVVSRVGEYNWENWGTPVAPMPAWLVKMLKKPERPAVPPRMVSMPREAAVTLAQRVLADRAHQVATAPASRRNVTLNSCAFYLGSHFVGAGLLDSAEVWAVLADAAAAAGLDDRETRATIASGLTAGIASPSRRAS